LLREGKHKEQEINQFIERLDTLNVPQYEIQVNTNQKKDPKLEENNQMEAALLA